MVRGGGGLGWSVADHKRTGTEGGKQDGRGQDEEKS